MLLQSQEILHFAQDDKKGEGDKYNMKTLIDLIKSFQNNHDKAIVHNNSFRRFSYAYNDLYEHSLRCASWLKRKNVKAGDKVLLWGPNSPEWLFSYFGIIATGAVVVPVDLKSSKRHAKIIAESADVKFVIKTKYKNDLELPSFYIENLQSAIQNQETIQSLPESKEEDLVELVFTSGTTGDPKGVMISHRNLVSNMQAVVKKINVSKNDCLLSVLPLSHLFEQTAGMLTPLSVGARVVYLSTIKPSAIFTALKNEPITIFLCVPRLLQGFKKGISNKFKTGAKRVLWNLLWRISSPLKEKAKKKVWFLIHSKFNNKFRFFVSGGSYLDPDTEKFWRSLGFKIVQGYGLTECSPILTVNSENASRLSSIGQALDNVELKLNPDKELLARGPNVFSGYYKNQEKTAEAFQDDWFLTGDIAEKDEDDFYYIKSRKKDMIVTASGDNVYPEEIENVLQKFPDVKEVAVLGLDQGQGEEVVAVFIPDSENFNKEETTKQANKELSLSQQIIKTFIWPEPEFPKTTTLKIKKNILKEKLQTGRQKKENPRKVSPVAKIISSIADLPLEEVSSEKLIYEDLKIDSIGRVELVSRLEQEFTLDISEDLITEKIRVKDLEEIISKRIIQKKKHRLYNRNFNSLFVSIRNCHWTIFGRPLTSFFCKLRIEGLENIENLEEPVIFAPNHVSYADGPAILLAMPKRIREKIAIAAWREFFFREENIFFKIFFRFFFFYVLIFWGIFPFSQKRNIKKTLEHTGSLMDKGFHILIFPEGKRTKNNHLSPLQKGIAIMQKNLACPIVPVYLEGIENVMKVGQMFPRRNKVTIHFGKPIYFQNENETEILEALNSEMKKLSNLSS